ncbi:MAG: capsular polysaccharide biosynthesis protein CapF [Prevotella sp.]|nr:capsular polysaccharide biosynthesis protein CapF [Prevotella sp.]
MKILITGAKGFVGRNLCESLKNLRDNKDRTRPDLKIDDVFEFDIETSIDKFEYYCANADFVFNLAGVNRPKDTDEFMKGNFGFANELISTLKRYGNRCPVMLSSSIQATLNNPYGVSKRAGEELFFDYATENGTEVLVYRFPNIFGKWCRPNYNSVIATFCYNIARDIPIHVNDANVLLRLVYIDDVVAELLDALEGKAHSNGKFYEVPVSYEVRLGEIVELLNIFHDQRRTLMVPSIPSGSFSKKLYSTYQSYLPKEKIPIPLKTNIDNRGSFTELLKTSHHGQFSVNISKPGVTKGQHWHNSKWEMFIVVSGHALIQERQIGSDEVIEFEASGEKLEAFQMLPGYTHSLINLSESEDLVTLMWVNEVFDPEKPDTYFEKVEE